MRILEQNKKNCIKIGLKIKKLKIWNPPLDPFYVKNGNKYMIMQCIFLKEIFLRNSLNRKSTKIRWKIKSPCTKQKHQFLHLRASCLETGRVTISQSNTNLYSVPMIIVNNIQKDSSTTTLVIERKPFCLQTDGNDNTIT